MTEEQKQALIERCEQKIKELSKVEFGIMHKDKLDLLIYCQAITNLTAQPVKLPQIIQIGYTHDEITAMCNVRNDAVAAIRAAGYQVEGE
ncbi:hypothetical protein LZU96_21350 (plasmid) [Pantoea agglomerans]|uniref:hypothetical protein n=1 Tax=Enterobacter agglomerans TaxID=549 RepID=UPI001F38E584|nr:hypothetical protein [Pantoea agglomerans]UIL54695.1 hypothetical protein LZU96_21350 [Pantoea agglomerans]